MDADTALDLIRRSHPGAHPNDGFMEQLRLFHAMGCRLDATNAQWRRHQVTQLASTQDGAAAARLNADPGNAPPAGGRHGQGTVRCRRCGRLLALMEHTILHEHGAGGARSFGVHKQRKGKLACPKCAGRLGAFSWAGEQCGCGCWVTPAFQLHVSRVDILPGTSAGVATHTHVPRVVELNKE